MIHPSKFACSECDQTFELSIALEMHLEVHQKPKSYKCDTCDKAFHLKWQFQKHIEGHNKSMKFCHFFNNKLPCPFDKIGCMFLHSISPVCKYKDDCSNSLCQYRHEKRSASNSRTSEDQDIFKHVMSSTPIRDEIMKHKCKMCAFEILPGHQVFKCEECENNVCENCAKESFDEDDPDWFMCLTCQR